MAKCMDCVFVHATEAGGFECRLNGPIMVPVTIQRTRSASSGVCVDTERVGMKSGFPAVDAFDFCGQFSPAPQSL